MTSVYIVRIIYTCTDANQGMACSQPYQRTSYADKLRPVIQNRLKQFSCCELCAEYRNDSILVHDISNFYYEINCTLLTSPLRASISNQCHFYKDDVFMTRWCWFFVFLIFIYEFQECLNASKLNFRTKYPFLLKPESK